MKAMKDLTKPTKYIGVTLERQNGYWYIVGSDGTEYPTGTHEPREYQIDVFAAAARKRHGYGE